MAIKQKGQLTWKAINSPKLDGKIRQTSNQNNTSNKYNWLTLNQFGPLNTYGSNAANFPLVYGQIDFPQPNFNYGSSNKNTNTNTGNTNTNTNKYPITSSQPQQPALEINLGGRRTNQGWEERITQAEEQGKSRKAAKLKEKYLKWSARNEKQAAKIDSSKDFDAAAKKVKSYKKPLFGKRPDAIKDAVAQLDVEGISKWEKK